MVGNHNLNTLTAKLKNFMDFLLAMSIMINHPSSHTYTHRMYIFYLHLKCHISRHTQVMHTNARENTAHTFQLYAH